MKKTLAIITLLIVASILLTSYAVSGYATDNVNHGVISIAFDDSYQSQFDYAFPLMQSRGMVGTFYIITDNIREVSGNSLFMNIAELQALQGNGSEIASHSKTHAEFLYLSEAEIRDECNASKSFLQSCGLNVTNFAYPFGDTNSSIDSIVSQFYRSGRSAYFPPYVMPLPYSQFNLTGFDGENGNSSASELLENIVDEVYSSNGWAVIFFNNVVPNNSSSVLNSNYRFQISTQDLSGFLDYIVSKGVKTLTVNQALDLATEPSSPSYPAPFSSPGSTWHSPGLTSSPSTSSSPSPSYSSASSLSPSPTASSSPSSSPTPSGDQSIPSVSPSSDPSLSPSVSPARADQAVTYYLYGIVALLLAVPLISAGIALHRKRKKSVNSKRNLLVSEIKQSR